MKTGAIALTPIHYLYTIPSLPGRSEGSDDRTVFAKGLSYSTSTDTLIETFGAMDARIPLNEEGRPKG